MLCNQPKLITHPRYLYGRGVSDNKGPILAVACAAASVSQRRELDVDLVMLIEGEEEAGSGGFEDTVRKNRVSIFAAVSYLSATLNAVGDSTCRGILKLELTRTPGRHRGNRRSPALQLHMDW